MTLRTAMSHFGHRYRQLDCGAYTQFTFNQKGAPDHTCSFIEAAQTVVVVGVAQVFGGPSEAPAYVNLPYFSRLTADVGRASSVQVTIEPEGLLEPGSTLEALQTHWMTPACG